MSPLVVRRTVAVLVVGGAEAYTYARYAAYGAQFHFWLHALLGGWVGLGVLAAWRALRPRARRRAGPVESGFAGHLYSAVPDLLFTLGGVLHARWMDVFDLHVTAHFLWPSPLGAGLVLWGLALAAFAATTGGARRTAGGLLVCSAAVLGVGVVLRSPLPTDLRQVRQAGHHPALAWTCTVDGQDLPSGVLAGFGLRER